MDGWQKSSSPWRRGIFLETESKCDTYKREKSNCQEGTRGHLKGTKRLGFKVRSVLKLVRGGLKEKPKPEDSKQVPGELKVPQARWDSKPAKEGLKDLPCRLASKQAMEEESHEISFINDMNIISQWNLSFDMLNVNDHLLKCAQGTRSCSANLIESHLQEQCVGSVVAFYGTQ